MIKIEDVSLKISENEILHKISFNANVGEVTTLIGPSGGGKSTILRCINGLESRFTGKIFVEEKEVKEQNMNLIRQNVGMIFQNFNLFNNFSVLENLTFAPVHQKKMTKKEACEKAFFWLSKMGLEPLKFAEAKPESLSGGQKQRVAIARCLMMNPKFILMDEPTSALDPENVQEVFAAIKELASLGISMIIATHEMSFAKEIGDWTIFLENGKIVEMSESQKFFNAPKTERAASFLGV